MATVTLGRTGITVDKNGFGALPVQRVSRDEAILLLQRAYDGGMTFFDTARGYSDSEEKMGLALGNVRQKIYIASKTMAQTAEGFWKDLETSLRALQTDYLDLYQFHNPAFCPKPGDENGLYDAALKAKEQGKIRFVGLSNHRLGIALETVECGLYDTLQFPFSYLSSDADERLVRSCAKANMGFIAMKALSGGLITHAAAAYAYLADFAGALPIWGIQREAELQEILGFVHAPPVMTAEFQAIIQADRKALSGIFCRGCGYCMPCPVGIQINIAARMSLLLRRSPPEQWQTPYWQAGMRLIQDCRRCGQCKKHCPYGLDTPQLLQDNLEDYLAALDGKPL